jgi:nitrite reductase (NADH) small subunit
MQWQTVCSVADLEQNAGVCALVDGMQVAIFYLPETAEQVYALSNYDPIGKAFVLSRGIVGDLEGQLVVASPLYKQHFSLTTGVCLEDETVSVPVYACRLEHDSVQVDTRSSSALRQLIIQPTAEPCHAV